MPKSCPNTLIYKMTHRGDPDVFGTFGAQNCMGRVRGQNFQAVIGIGARSAWKEDEDLVGRVVWIGLAPRKIRDPRFVYPVVVFGKIVRFDQQPSEGPQLETIAPGLLERVFRRRTRHIHSASLPAKIREEVASILLLAESSAEPSSTARSRFARQFSRHPNRASRCYDRCHGPPQRS